MVINYTHLYGNELVRNWKNARNMSGNQNSWECYIKLKTKIGMLYTHLKIPGNVNLNPQRKVPCRKLKVFQMNQSRGKKIQESKRLHPIWYRECHTHHNIEIYWLSFSSKPLQTRDQAQVKQVTIIKIIVCYKVNTK